MLFSQILLALEMKMKNIKDRNKTSQLNFKYNLVNVPQSNSIYFNSYLLITCWMPNSFLLRFQEKQEYIDPTLSEPTASGRSILSL